jgi:hypothetical protein
VFVQVIKGKLADRDRLRAAVDRWQRELASGATGWLGTTAGVTEDGTSIAFIRFESEEAAQRNSDRPEQAEWWAEASQAFDGDPTFINSSDVEVDTPGNPDDAGFVQVMEGRGSDPDKAREIMARDSGKMAQWRPDILGSLVANYGDGQFIMAIYFTSEEAAREGEKKEMPPEMAANMEELNSLLVGDMSFYDLRDPWLDSPS